MTPTISIVLTTHPGRDLECQEAIASVQAQTYTDWELIVVHDGDREAWEGFPRATEQIHYTTLPRFGNDTKPKNEGIKISKGRYVAFLDSDNTWRPDHLSALVRELEARPEIDLVYGDRWVTDETGGNPPALGYTTDFDPYLLLQRNYIDTSDVLVRRTALEYVGGFDEEQSKYIDWNLWCRMAKAGFRMLRVPLLLTDYTLSASSKSYRVLTKAEQAYKEKTGKFRNLPDWDPIDCEIRLPYLGEVPEPRVAIFSLTYDRADYTRACFESLKKTARYPYDHYVVDNGSSDNTTDVLVELGITHTLYNNENQGISKGSNQALDMILNSEYGFNDYDIIVKVDNDALFLTDGWLAKMVEIYKSNHLLALSPYVQGLRDSPGGAPRQAYGQIRGEMIGMTQHLGGICHFAPARAYEQWRWSEDDFLHGMQDLEFSQYLTSIGYQMGYLENFFVTHIDGTEGQHAKYPDYFERRKLEKRTRYEKSKS